VWGVLYEVPDFLIERKTAAAQNRSSLAAIEGEGTNTTSVKRLLFVRTVALWLKL
jgi:hypothetical protein